MLYFIINYVLFLDTHPISTLAHYSQSFNLLIAKDQIVLFTEVKAVS